MATALRSRTSWRTCSSMQLRCCCCMSWSCSRARRRRGQASGCRCPLAQGRAESAGRLTPIAVTTETAVAAMHAGGDVSADDRDEGCGQADDPRRRRQSSKRASRKSPEVAAGQHVEEGDERDEAEYGPDDLDAATHVLAGGQVNPHENDRDRMQEAYEQLE